MICSVSDVPDRGMPTSKTGRDESDAPLPTAAMTSGV